MIGPRASAGIVLAVLAACGDNYEDCGIDDGRFDANAPMCQHLSSYRLFDDLAAQTPASRVFAYDVNTPLFSDYTTKSRFVWIPDDATARWSDAGAFVLPVGAILVKTFAYRHDRRDPSLGSRLLETRLLVHADAGWRGAAYVYDADGRDAQLALAGDLVGASWIHDDGTTRTNSYVVPNANQCKDCHAEHDNTISPLGMKARHVNRLDDAGAGNQLQELIDAGALTGAPSPDAWPRAPVATDPSTGTLDQRARAWLDINCGHCHNPSGMARTSGLFLDVAETSALHLGTCKPPVATGRGSGGLLYDIVPGQPDASILVYRISQTAPEIKMPQLGRNLVYDEGVALIREWIAAMPGGC